MRFIAALAAFLFGSSSVNPPEVRHIVDGPGDTVVATIYTSATPGSKNDVILVPGLLGAAYTYRNLAPALAASGENVVVIEPLGFGASARPKDADYSLEAQATRLGHAVDSLAITRATFVCHSVGASICMRLSLQRPAVVRGIISLNGGPDETAGTNGLKTSLRLAPILKLFGAQRIIRGKVKDGLRNSSANPAWVTDQVITGYTAPFSNFNAVLTSFRGMVNAHERAPLRPRLNQIKVPFTVMVGAGKPEAAISKEDLRMIVDNVPHVVVDSVADAGQYIQEEKPDAIVAAVHAQQRLR
jgi:pimeloyl-ACP methyl ester carboxylesterase